MGIPARGCWVLVGFFPMEYAAETAQDDVEFLPEFLLRRHLAGVLGGLGEQRIAGARPASDSRPT